MRAVVVEHYGGVGNLQIQDIAVPDVAPNEVLVRVRAAGVNLVDTLFRDGYLSTGPFPLVQGSDFAGRIERVGEDETGFEPGQSVYGYKYLGNGTYADFVAVDAALVGRMPTTLSFAQAAGVPCVGLVAYDALVNTVELSAGQTVLITAASGGVGQIAVQLAKYIGATVLATTSTRNLEFVRALGADHVIDYTAGNYVAAVRELVSDGVDVALPAAAETLETVAGAVRDGGVVASITGHASAPRGITVSVTNGSRGTGLLDRLTELFESGALTQVHIDGRFDLEHARDAQSLVVEGHVRGKLVIDVSTDD